MAAHSGCQVRPAQDDVGQAVAASGLLAAARSVITAGASRCSPPVSLVADDEDAGCGSQTSRRLTRKPRGARLAPPRFGYQESARVDACCAGLSEAPGVRTG
jgi:hypothetical protein